MPPPLDPPVLLGASDAVSGPSLSDGPYFQKDQTVGEPRLSIGPRLPLVSGCLGAPAARGPGCQVA